MSSAKAEGEEAVGIMFAVVVAILYCTAESEVEEVRCQFVQVECLKAFRSN